MQGNMHSVNELKVTTANGSELRCKEICRQFVWKMQGQVFEAEVLALPLDKYDLVLGIQWLRELGDIVWNFKTLQMKFCTGEKEVTLQGNQVPGYAVAAVSEGKLSKIF